MERGTAELGGFEDRRRVCGQAPGSGPVWGPRSGLEPGREPSPASGRLRGALPAWALASALLAAAPALPGAAGAWAQEPISWGPAGAELHFATFSIAAVDRATGEAGVAVTTRVACVGNGVPWVRAGVGAVATQANTRVEYGQELLELLAGGTSPDAALAARIAEDPGSASRQVGVIGVDGRSAQHTGSSAQAWAGHRAGPDYVTQGNILVGPEVLDAVARTFEASAGSPRHLADRLVEALAAGQAAGGDSRKGRLQSAAVVVADPRPGMSRRPDGITVHINVCEHPEPVGELRRIHDAISQTLGYRTLEHPAGNDIWQLRVILHALGYFRPEQAELERGPDATLYTLEVVGAVDRFRGDRGLATPGLTPPGLVDGETVAHLWQALDEQGKTDEVRRRLLEVVQIRR